jgi:hypothetical protein
MLGLFVLIWLAAAPQGESPPDGSSDAGLLSEANAQLESLPVSADQSPPDGSLDGSLENGPQEGSEASGQRYSIYVRRPSGPPTVAMASGEPEGPVARIACSTCHSTREPNFDNKDHTTLDEFHQGLEVKHHKVACYACHHPEDADSLRSADGRRIPYDQVMTLCSQCHGPQSTAFAHGAHGGMTGFWDLSRGPQMKNNCIDCHDPHAPQFPKMIVEFKPYDRFLEGKADHDDHE